MLASFSVLPVGVGEELREHIAAVVDLIDGSGLTYKLGAMQTTLEGDQAEVMDAAVESGVWEAVLTGYNYHSPKEVGDAIKRTQPFASMRRRTV